MYSIVSIFKYIANFDKYGVLDNNLLSWEAHLNLTKEK